MLFIFLLGFFFSAWGGPLLDNMFNTIAAWFQVLQSNMTVKIAKNQAKVAELTKSKDGNKSLAIGFTIPQEEEECEDDEDL